MAEVFADFVFVDFECCGEFDVVDVVAAIVDVHESGYCFGFFGVFVVLCALNERAGAVADAYDCCADFWQVNLTFCVMVLG